MAFSSACSTGSVAKPRSMLNIAIFDPWQRSLFSRPQTPGKQPLLAGNLSQRLSKQLLIKCLIYRMAHRLTSHHRALFSPKYFSGTSAHITTTSYFRAPFDVKDKDEFKQKVLGSTKPVLVDFHADWCGPCKALTPRLDAIIGENSGLLELAKVDVDVHADLAIEYKVLGVPTVLGIKDGKVIDQFSGVIGTDELRTFVEKLLK